MDSCVLQSLCVLVLASLAASPLAVQVPSTNVVDIEPIELPAYVTRTEIGRVVPFHGRSVVLQWGSELQLAYAPTVHQLSVSLASGVSSFVILPGGAGSDRDEILVADGGGLYTLRYTTGSSEPYFAATSLGGSSNCVNAVGLACGDWNHDGKLDIAAISAAQDRVYVLTADGSGGYSETHFDPLHGGARKIEPIAWDSDGDAELALLSTWGTEVYDASGTQLFQRNSGFGSDHVMTVLHPSPGGGSAQDGLAVVQRGSNGTNRLLAVHRRSGTDTAVNLGNCQVMGIGAGDLDLDGDCDQDLALSLEGTTRSVRTLYDAGCAPHFANTPVTQLDIGTGNAVPSLCDPAVGDLNDDGRADVAEGVEYEGQVVFNTHMTPGDVAGGWSTAGTGPATPFEEYRVFFRADDTSTWNTETSDNVETELTLSNSWLGGGSSISQSYMEVILWTKSSTANTVGQIPKHFVYSLPPDFKTGAAQMRVGFELPNLADGSSHLSYAFHQVQFVEVRPVNYNPVTHKVLDPLETHVGGFTLELSTDRPSLLYLEQRAGACSSCEPGVEVESMDGGGSTRYAGGFVPQANVPPTPGHVMPTIAEPIPLTGVQFGG